MASNDKYLLDQLILESKSQIAPDLSESDYFEIFVTELLLRNFSLSYDEIDAGVVGGGNDGGIDTIYAFVDDELVAPDSIFVDGKTIEMVAIQAKRSTSFSESAMKSLISTFHDLLDLETDFDSLKTAYSSNLLGFFRNFRRVYRSLIPKFPAFKISVYYATKGNSDEVHPNVVRLEEQLKERISSRFSEFDLIFQFIGARDLLVLARRQSLPALQLRIVESLSPADGGYVCLVSLEDYYRFITDENGKRRQVIFDANVREYEGWVEVNKGISRTLAEGSPGVNFWWLNNGITIVAARVALSGKNLVLEDAKVVNGLQTSQEIYNYFSRRPQVADERLILVRIVETDSETVRNEIIKATNSQSRIPAYSLRATEPIHHDIEQDFKFNGLYYDRQKNYYKNQKKPKSQIVTIQYLAQAVAAIVLQRPNDSRGRPTSLIKDEIYKHVFSDAYPMSLYLNCVRLMRVVDSHLRTDAPEQAAREKTNLRFPMAMFIACMLAKSSDMNAKIFSKISVDDIDSKMLEFATDEIWAIFSSLKVEKGLDGDLIAKNKDFDFAVLDRIKHLLAHRNQVNSQ